MTVEELKAVREEASKRSEAVQSALYLKGREEFLSECDLPNAQDVSISIRKTYNSESNSISVTTPAMREAIRALILSELRQRIREAEAKLKS